MKIACLGWGSLIWDPQTLLIRGDWFNDGPNLPIEFARESNNDRITLVITNVDYRVRSLWALLETENFDDAKKALASREGISDTNIKYSIGFWDGNSGESNGLCATEIGDWAKKLDIDAVVWTNLKCGFKSNRGTMPTCAEILEYLQALSPESKKKAKKYICKAPIQIATEYRKQIEDNLGWQPEKNQKAYMHISKVSIKNFRLLRDSTLDLRQNLSLLVGKNNSGKTSLLVLFEKFISQTNSFHYNDFSLSLRDKILTLNQDTEIDDLSIRMVLEIKYDESDNLANLSEFILDLDPEIKTVKILFECRIDKKALLNEVSEVKKEERKEIIIKSLSRHLISRIYVFDDSSHDGKDDFFKINRHKLVEKDLKDIKKLINLQFIHARRNVYSSDESNDSKKPLSALTTAYFNSSNDVPNDDLVKINQMIVGMDADLGARYESFFEDFLKNSKKFLNLKNLSVISNIQSKMLFDHSSQVIYGSDDNHLPEHLNGLGYMNILYLLLQIEIKKEDFKKHSKDINLLFIEEPEAHTHPQMQYIFANQIRTVLKEIEGLQTLITSHSSHIVSQSDFKDIRYLKIAKNDNVEIKNFHTELEREYSGKEQQFKFLEQYLNIQSAELFFASKVIFIEGITERMLLPYFIQKFDKVNSIGNDKYIPLVSQNISILEVGANAKVFAPFLEFLDIKTLIITDIDTMKVIEREGIDKKTNYKAEPVATSTHTSNVTLKYFLNAPKDVQSKEFEDWFSGLCKQSLKNAHDNIKVAYQKEETGYHARSFEDAFVSINKDVIKSNKSEISGLKNRKQFDTCEDIYKLTENVLDKKSDFAASLLYLALSRDDIQWEIPLYIKEGLSWIQEQ